MAISLMRKEISMMREAISKVSIAMSWFLRGREAQARIANPPLLYIR